MNPKILAVLLIALILVQYSYQDAVSAAPRAKADKSKADTARTIKTDQTKPTPMYTQVAATPAWGRGYGLPVDWNHDGISIYFIKNRFKKLIITISMIKYFKVKLYTYFSYNSFKTLKN